MTEYMNGPVVRAAVSQDWRMGGVAVTLGIRDNHGGYRILHFPEEQEWEDVPPQARVERPTFSIQEEFARALYNALAEFFQGQPDVTTARADLIHERTRRNKLEDNLMAIAEALVTTPVTITETRER